MPASPATPPRRARSGSTGRCRTARTASSSSSAPTTCCAASIPPSRAQALEAIIQRLKARGIPVLLAGMYASPNLGPDYAARFDAIYPGLARTHGLVLYPFFLDGVAGERALNLPDGMHPTAQGVEQIVERILPSVESFIARMRVRARAG